MKNLSKSEMLKICFYLDLERKGGKARLHLLPNFLGVRGSTMGVRGSTMGVCTRVLRDSSECRKIQFVPSRRTNGTVPKFFETGQTGSGQFEENAAPKILNLNNRD